MSESLIFLSESLIFGQKTSDLLGNQMSGVPALGLCRIRDYVIQDYAVWDYAFRGYVVRYMSHVFRRSC